jgi:C4-dicarboxylate transporter DctM subunit
MVVNLAIGFVTPPVGLNLYVASSITGVPVISIARAALPFIVAFGIALVAIIFIPGISLILT